MERSLLPDAIYVSDYISRETATKLLSEIDNGIWLNDLKRRVQHYGYKYDYRSRRASMKDYLGDLPDWLSPLSSKLREDSHFASTPEQVIVNEYEPGQGISAHVDCEPCFGETIASISLGSACEMRFQHLYTNEIRNILLQPNSLLVLSGQARYDWNHSIMARKSDVIDGKRQQRQRRLSLTFRTMLF